MNNLRNRYPQLDFQALVLGELLPRLLGHGFIGGAEKRGQRLQHLHLRAEPPPYTAKLEPDHAGTDHAEALGHRVESQRAFVVADDLVVDRYARQVPGFRSGGDHDVFRLYSFRINLYFPSGSARDELAMSLQPGDLVLLEQAGDPARHPADDPVLPVEHGLQVELHAARGDAVHLELVQHARVVLRGLEQGFRRDAADIQAGAAERVFAPGCLPLLHAGGGEPELRGADRGDVARRSCADHDDIEGVHISRIRRAGSSRASLILTKHKTASRPSMMRWSYDSAR